MVKLARRCAAEITRKWAKRAIWRLKFPFNALVVSDGEVETIRVTTIYPKVELTLRPADQWNAVEVEFRGTRLKLTINRQVIEDLPIEDRPNAPKHSERMLRKSGHIGLLCSSGHAEFRRIEIQELDAAGEK